MVEQVNRFITGWVTYYPLRANARARCATSTDGFVASCDACGLKRCKRVRTMIDFLTGHGVTRVGAIKLASSGKGWWRLTDATQVKQAMSIAWFTALGLTSMADHHAALNLAGNRRGT